MEILKPGFPQQLGKASPTTLGFPTSPHRSGDDHHQLNLLTEGVGQIRRSKVGHTGWTKPSGGMAAVSGGIAEALIATGMGIFVAIPAVVSFNYFTGKLENFRVEMNRASSQLVNCLLKVPELVARDGKTRGVKEHETAYAVR